MTLTANSTPKSGYPKKKSDLSRSISLFGLSIFMALKDVQQRYRGSTLGPIWLSGGVAAVSLGLALLYSSILHQNMEDFLPYVVIGLTVWTMIQVTFAEASTAFVANAGTIKNSPLPIGIQILRVVSRNLILLIHNAVVVAIVFALLRRPLSPGALLVVPGLFLLAINLIWMSYCIALISARYRDVAQIITYLLQFAMFVTPIFWLPNMAGRSRIAVDINPVYHMIEVVRAPLMGHLPSLQNWEVVIALSVFGGVLTWGAQHLYAKRVVFWL